MFVRVGASLRRGAVLLAIALAAALALAGGAAVTQTASASSRTFVGIGVTGNGGGYGLVASSGENYDFGNVVNHGNPSGFNGGIVAVAVTADGKGYVEVSAVGQVYAYGTVQYHGNPSGFSGSITGISVTANGSGYIVVSSAGQNYAYGTVQYHGNPSGFTGNIIGVSVTADGSGYADESSIGQVYAYGTVQYWGNGDPGSPDLVTAQMLQSIFGVSSSTINQGLPSLNSAMLAGNITNAPRVAALLATLKAESGFRFNAVEGGCATKYCGRGYIQLTGQSNYSAASSYFGHDFVNNPADAASLTYSAPIMQWYWTVTHNINALADAYNMDGVTRAVNGSGASTTTLRNRCTWFKDVLAYYNLSLPSGAKCTA
jgi:predicted chitinase